MRTTLIILSGLAGALMWTAASAQEATIEVFAAGNASSTSSRDQYLAREAAHAREMAAKGWEWNQLYSRWDFTGNTPPPAAKPTMSRQEFLDKEASEKRSWASRGYIWSQLWSAYQYVGAGR